MSNLVGDLSAVPELRKRTYFTLGLLVIYRLGIFVPTPGIDGEKIRQLFSQASGTIFGIVNMFSGGALENFSIFALGVMPYISVSIIVQLLTSSFKSLEELSKEGEQGRRKITTYTRIGAIFLALVQGFFISKGLAAQGLATSSGMSFHLTTAITLAAGTAFVMWLGEQISEKGLGNGISIIIAAGIVARVPSMIRQTFLLVDTGEVSPAALLLALAFATGIIALVVFVEKCQRRIPVSYPRRTVGRNVVQPMSQHLPLKLNTAGVIPPIFASSMLAFPATIAQFSGIAALTAIVTWLQANIIVYDLIFLGLVLFFAYFYTALVLDPNQLADNLKKNGGFIPTVRPGKETSEFISRVMTRLTLWGALYISFVCLVPNYVYSHLGLGSFSFILGGTAVLIVVGVVTDTFNQIESHVLAKNYEIFMNKAASEKAPNMYSKKGSRLIQR